MEGRLGYVRRTSEPSDGRAKLVVPTKRGLAALAAGLATIVEIEHDLERLLGPTGLARLRRALERILGDA